MTPLAAGAPAVPAEALAGQVTATTRIADLSARVVRSERPFAVHDAAGQLVGHLTRDAVIKVLAEEGRAKNGDGS